MAAPRGLPVWNRQAIGTTGKPRLRQSPGLQPRAIVLRGRSTGRENQKEGKSLHGGSLSPQLAFGFGRNSGGY